MRIARLAVLVLVTATVCRDGSTPAVAPATSTTPTVPATTATSTAAPTTTTTLPAPAWQNRAVAPTARQEVASAVADGRVWVIGGLTAAGASAVVESYDPATDRWAPGPALPVALHHAAATTYRGEIVVIGGFVAAAGLYDRASDRVLALRAGAWVDLPRLRRPRGAGAAAVVGDAVVLAGGRNDAALIGPTEIFDGTAWRDGEAIPTRRDHLSAASDGRSLFTVGGRFLSPGALSAALERYDPATNAWERLPALPTARGGQGATMVPPASGSTASGGTASGSSASGANASGGGRLVVAGGEDPSGVYDEVEAYDVAAQRWSTLPPLPTPRHGLAVERIGNQVVALVGGTAYGVAPSAVAQALLPLN